MATRSPTERCEAICAGLAAKGFVPTCIFGIGSYTYQYNTRDTFGFAMKATAGIVDGELREIYKDPKTGNGLKEVRSGFARGWTRSRWRTSARRTNHLGAGSRLRVRAGVPRWRSHPRRAVACNPGPSSGIAHNQSNSSRSGWWCAVRSDPCRHCFDISDLTSGPNAAVAVYVLGQGPVSLSRLFLERPGRLQLALALDETDHLIETHRSDEFIF